MDISEEIESLLSTVRVLSKDSEEYIKLKGSNYPELTLSTIAKDIIDVTQINFSDDETWLSKPEGDSNVTDLSAWLHEDTEVLKDLDFHTKHFTLMREMTKLDSAKKIVDSRTFTRPKKRFSRPSLDLNDSHFNKLTEFVHNRTIEKGTDCSNENTSTDAPLNFDLSEPANNIFNNLGKNESDLDSFQNMSPPSLVSSSMFSSIMENSYIKNDPVLREIRDTDYTDVILQGCDPTLLKSFTGSCSSVDSDTPEGFLKRSVETTFSKSDLRNVSNEAGDNNGLNDTYIPNNTVVFNTTFQKESSSNKSRSFAHLDQGELDSSNNISSNKMSSILNTTYRKNSNENLNNTFSIVQHNEDKNMKNEDKNMKNEDLNRTIIIDVDCDSNKLNYSKRRSCIIEDSSKPELKYNTFLKRNRCSLGSSDSLDCVSSLSNSSSGKGSSKMLNMAEVDAIVLQQEQSLQQVMSTPKPSGDYASKLYDYSNISPIRQLDLPNNLSDSEGSSNDDYLTVGSGSSKSITSGNSDSVSVVLPKNLHSSRNKSSSVNSTKNSEVAKKQTTNVNKNLQYGSYTNLHKAKVIAQQKNVPAATNAPIKTYAQSNLKSMDAKLKSSYTQLKPVFTNLPSTVMPSTKALPQTQVNKATIVTEAPVKIAEVAPTLRDMPKTASNNNNGRGLRKPSGLPRPVSGIPRPASSKIPGSLRLGIPQSRPISRVNIDTDF